MGTDDYPGETSWDIVDADGNVIESRDVFPFQNTLHVDTFCLPYTAACGGYDYTFTIYDSYGDGICCGYGSGNYDVTFDGVLIASGGDFGSSESTSPCGATSCQVDEFQVIVEVLTDDYPGETSCRSKTHFTKIHFVYPTQKHVVVTTIPSR